MQPRTGCILVLTSFLSRWPRLVPRQSVFRLLHAQEIGHYNSVLDGALVRFAIPALLKRQVKAIEDDDGFEAEL